MAVHRPGSGGQFDYAGQPLRLTSAEAPWAAGELVVPANFAGPVPHVHETFDEGLYVLEGRILAGTGRDRPAEAGPGDLLMAPRGTRHFFSNPFDEPARVLGLWSPADAGVAFMRAVGAALPASGPPDPVVMRQLYEAHGSRLDP
jgi:mannose-6-phosphate isomerase-like protein (cupin superfamily)